MLIMIKIIDRKQKFNHIMYSLTFLALLVFEFTELGAYLHN